MSWSTTVGATDKTHDIDMDGFRRRLSWKLCVDLPNARTCEGILEGALETVRHQVHEIEMVELGKAYRDKGLSGFDYGCLVEGLGHSRRSRRMWRSCYYYIDGDVITAIVLAPPTVDPMMRSLGVDTVYQS